MEVRRCTDEPRSDAPGFDAVLDAAQLGEEWALAALWRRLQPALLRFLRGRDPRGAEDVASETWIRVGRALPSFVGGEAEFRAWFFTIARRTLIDTQRRTSRRPNTVALDAAAEAAARDDPAEDAVAACGLDRVLALVGTLPADQADVVLLRVIAGLDVADVAAMTGKRPGTVRVLQHRALRRLAAVLDLEPAVERS